MSHVIPYVELLPEYEWQQWYYFFGVMLNDSEESKNLFKRALPTMQQTTLHGFVEEFSYEEPRFIVTVLWALHFSNIE